MMNEILVNIREEIGEVNLINSCGGRGCRVDMIDVPSERIIVNVDTAFPAHQIAGKRCDRILVCSDCYHGSSETISLSASSCCANALSSGLRFTACPSEPIAF